MILASEWLLVALGANLGDPRRQLREARAELEARFACKAGMASSIWCSAPLGCPPGSPDFLNAVLAFPLTVAPSAPAALATLQGVERAFGRVEGALRNAPRTLDLDLILFGELEQSDPDCVLPHPRALQRRFVLEPAAEVLPELIWPGTTRSIAGWRDALREQGGQGGIARVPDPW